MLAISRPAVALPSVSNSMAQASSVPCVSSGQASLMIRWLWIWPSGISRAPTLTRLESAAWRKARTASSAAIPLRFRRCAEDHGLMPLRAPVAHRRGKGRKGGGREDVAIGAEQRAPGLERGLARLPAQLDRAGDMVEVHEGVEIVFGGATVGVRDRGSVRRRGAIAEPVAAGALEARRVVERAGVDPGLEAVGVVERAGRERGVRHLEQVEEPVRPLSGHGDGRGGDDARRVRRSGGRRRESCAPRRRCRGA